jgi:hypothetical protein
VVKDGVSQSFDVLVLAFRRVLMLSRTRSFKSGSVGVGVPAVEVSCTDVVIEDGVVASPSIVLNCTVLLSLAF